MSVVTVRPLIAFTLLALCATSLWGNEIVSDRGTYVVNYTSIPDPIPLNEVFELRVEVRERNKTMLATGLSLDVDAGMPAHNHGMFTRPEIEQLDDGSFRVTAMLFHMPGEWRITFVVHRGAIRETAVTNVVMK